MLVKYSPAAASICCIQEPVKTLAVFAKKLKLQVDAKNKLVQGVYGKEAMFDFETIYNQYLGYAEEIRNHVAIVFQNPDNQFIGSTVEDDIAFGLENRLVKSEQMEDIIYEYILTKGVGGIWIFR